MASIEVKRKLAVIFAADFEGYSRLMRADEEGTLETLRAYREIIDSCINRHGGRVFSTAGDSVVAEFGSAVEAVRCAITTQEELAPRNVTLPGHRRMRLRIGINLGDVMIDHENLLGDGVNVAARLEGLAEPGGICISGDVYNQIKHKLSVGFEEMGFQQVKNISEPVLTYRIVPGAAGDQTSRVRASRALASWRIPLMVVTFIIIVAVGAVALWETVFQSPRTSQKPPEPAAAQATPDTPSIAVLPFKNLTGDRSQDDFTDSVSEAIITQLARVPQISVAARNSSFTYKDKPTKAQEVGQELGVGYVLDGSVMRANDQVQVTMQLVEASTGKNLWAANYERQSNDIFVLQDEISTRFAARTLMVLGLPHEALQLLERAIRLRPETRASLLRLLAVAAYYAERYDEAVTVSRQSLEGQTEHGSVRVILVASLIAAGRKKEAQVEARKIIAQNPNFSVEAPATRGVFGAFQDEKVKERLRDHLRQAGLPE